MHLVIHVLNIVIHVKTFLLNVYHVKLEPLMDIFLINHVFVHVHQNIIKMILIIFVIFVTNFVTRVMVLLSLNVILVKVVVVII